jgi:hypothetical protein
MVIRKKLFSVASASILAVSSMIWLATPAAAVCNSADCVPNVTRDVVPNAPCLPRKYFNYGFDASGGTLVCNKIGVWTVTGPLVGVYNVSLRCATFATSAQGSDGVAFQCLDMGGGGLRWAHRTDTLE